MFSSLQKQKKAESLVEAAKNAVSEADARFIRARERLLESLERLDKTRSRLIQETIPLFLERYESFEREKPISLTPLADESFGPQVRMLYERIAIEPVQIATADRGKTGALLAAVTGVAVALIFALIVAAVGTGAPLAIATFTQPDHLSKMLAWLGGGAFNMPWASPWLGALGLITAAVTIWLVIWSMRMGQKARRNLAAAQKSFEAAEEYAARKEAFAERAENLTEKITDLEEILCTCEIYMDEYNATLRRILHTEGKDFEKLKETSRKLLSRAAACEEALIPLLNIAIVTSDGAPSDTLETAIVEGQNLVEALLDERPFHEAVNRPLASPTPSQVTDSTPLEDQATASRPKESLRIGERTTED